MTGRDYSKHKNTFKEIMKKHDLRWSGTFERPWWGSGLEKVTAVYDRDEDRNVTVSATLTWEGSGNTAFLKEFQDWAKDIGAEVTEDRSVTKLVIDDLLFFEMVYKPQVDFLKSEGRPESWIEKDLVLWEEEREKRFGSGDLPNPD